MENISVIVLAGGKSSRMGTDKGLIDFNGMKIIERVLQNVRSLADDILIISNDSDYKQFGYPVYEDTHKNCGPLGGIHSGLSNSKTDWNLVIGCDLPFITKEFLSFLISKISIGDAFVPVHHSLAEPLCTLYNKSSLPKIESLLLKQELKMQIVLKHLNSIFIKVPEEKFDSTVLFKNFNTPESITTETQKHRVLVK